MLQCRNSPLQAEKVKLIKWHAIKCNFIQFIAIKSHIQRSCDCVRNVAGIYAIDAHVWVPLAMSYCVGDHAGTRWAYCWCVLEVRRSADRFRSSSTLQTRRHMSHTHTRTPGRTRDVPSHRGTRRRSRSPDPLISIGQSHRCVEEVCARRASYAASGWGWANALTVGSAAQRGGPLIGVCVRVCARMCMCVWTSLRGPKRVAPPQTAPQTGGGGNASDGSLWGNRCLLFFIQNFCPWCDRSCCEELRVTLTSSLKTPRRTVL